MHARINVLARFAALAATAVCVTAQAGAPAKWTIQTLGNLGGGGTIPLALNNRGDVAGWAHTASGDIHAFLWQNGTMIDAGTPNGRYTEFDGINDRGVALGRAGESIYTYQDGTWTPSPVATGFPEGINKFGDIAGIQFTSAGMRGFAYRNGVLWEVPPLGTGISEAYAINDRGVVAGGATVTWGQEHAITFKDGVIQDLGTLGGPYAVAWDINNRGVVVGQSSDGTFTRAFVWDGTMRVVCDLPGQSDAQAINDRGDIVGDVGPKAYLCQDGKATILNDIPEVKAAGWVQLFPRDINERGWITGWGYKYGGSPSGEGFLLMPK